MPLDASAYQAMIVEEVGDTPAGAVAAQIVTIWTMFDDRAPIGRQYLYAKRKAIDLLMGIYRKQVNIVNRGQQAELSHLMRNLQIMRDAVSDEIGDDKVDTQRNAQSRRGARIGRLTTTSPLGAAVGLPGFDPNDQVYRGDAIAERRRR